MKRDTVDSDEEDARAKLSLKKRDSRSSLQVRHFFFILVISIQVFLLQNYLCLFTKHIHKLKRKFCPKKTVLNVGF